MADESLQQAIARFQREKADADERYNAALTALDRALVEPPSWTELPSPPEYARSDDLNRLWNVAAPPAPSGGRSIGGWVRRLVWQMVSPVFDAQRQFNSALVDHANRTAADSLTRYAALQGAIETLKAEAGARARFESHLIQFLQTVTWYVDTKDRQVESASLVLNAALSGISDDWMKRWESLKTREDRLLKEVQALGRSFDAAQATGALAQQTALSLKRDVEALLAEVRGRAFGGRPGHAHASGRR